MMGLKWTRWMVLMMMLIGTNLVVARVEHVAAKVGDLENSEVARELQNKVQVDCITEIKCTGEEPQWSEKLEKCVCPSVLEQQYRLYYFTILCYWGLTFIFLVMSVIYLQNKESRLPPENHSLDCGIICTWSLLSICCGLIGWACFFCVVNGRINAMIRESQKNPSSNTVSQTPSNGSSSLDPQNSQNGRGYQYYHYSSPSSFQTYVNNAMRSSSVPRQTSSPTSTNQATTSSQNQSVQLNVV